MIWIESQEGNLFYCSAVKYKRVTANQILIINQNNETLGEYSNMNDVKKTLTQIIDVLTYKEVKIFSMPKKFDFSND